jgi:hypothetical protein
MTDGAGGGVVASGASLGGSGGSGGTSVAGLGGSQAGTVSTGDGAGAGGTGGDEGVVRPHLCEGAPIPLKASWKASASHSSIGAGEFDNPPENVMDQTTKRWSTGKAQSGDEWLQVDFGVSAAIRELTFTLLPDDAEDYPRNYQIRISDKALDFTGTVRASGAGMLGQTLVVTLVEPVVGRYLLVQQKGAAVENWWSVSELSATCL